MAPATSTGSLRVDRPPPRLRLCSRIRSRSRATAPEVWPIGPGPSAAAPAADGDAIPLPASLPLLLVHGRLVLLLRAFRVLDQNFVGVCMAACEAPNMMYIWYSHLRGSPLSMCGEV